jgi:hypothetical protein
MPIPYITTGASITAAKMNAIFEAFDNKLSVLLGGRSFALAFAFTGKAGSSDDAGWTYFSVPYGVWGKTFFFTSGVTAYSQFVPGYRPQSVSIVDPVTGATVTGTGARTYSHSEFVAAATGATVIDYDSTSHVATIEDTPQASYPAGLTKMPGVSIFEHSLQTHTRQLQGPNDDAPRTYWLREQSCPTPTKYYNYALADIVIEGVDTVDLPESYDKFKCFRFHNLQDRTCTVSLGGFSISLQPFECKSARRDSDYLGRGIEAPGGAAVFTNYRLGFRYFQRFEADDWRHFWFHPVLPGGSRYFRAVTSADGMQANNISNPAVLYDFIKALTNTRNYAWFNRDPHELCDIYNLIPEYREKFGRRGSTATTIDNCAVGDLIHHRGPFVIVRKVGDTTTFEDAEFRGYSDLGEFIADMQARQIEVGTDSAGNMTLLNVAPGAQTDIILTGTNFLKTSLDADDWFVPTAINIDSARSIEAAILESRHAQVPVQDIFGEDGFALRDASRYKITQRETRSTARSRTYRDFLGRTVTASGEPLSEIAEVSGAADTMSSIHKTTTRALLTLRHFGNASLRSQDVGVEFTDRRLTLTPEGLVLTFTEKVRADLLPAGLAKSFYENQFRNRLKYNPATDRFELHHAIRFRKHGFGWGQHGRDNVAFYGPIYGRPQVTGYKHEIVGPNGADYSAGPQNAAESQVRVLRRVGVQELLPGGGAGRRFLVSSGGTMLDELIDFTRNKTAEWFTPRRPLMLSLNTNSHKSTFWFRQPLIAMPLAAEHYNGMAQAVNQLKTGRPLDWRCLRFPYGNKIISLDYNDPDTTNTRATHWTAAFAGRPAPADAMLGTGGNAYIESWCASVGLSITGNSRLPPSWSACVNEFNKTSEYIIFDYAGSVSGAHHAGTKQVTTTSYGVRPFQVFNATVNYSVSGWRLSPEVNVERGVAGVPITSRNNGWPKINLADYPAIKWISADQFRAFCVARGFPFVWSELVSWLSLSRAEFPTELAEVEIADAVAPSGTYSGEVYIRDMGANPSQSDINIYVELLNRGRDSGTVLVSSGFRGEGSPNSISVGWSRSQILFHYTTEGGEWKWPISTGPPPRIYTHKNRSAGAAVDQHPLFAGSPVFVWVGGAHIGFGIGSLSQGRIPFQVSTQSILDAPPWFRTSIVTNPPPNQPYAFSDGGVSVVQGDQGKVFVKYKLPDGDGAARDSLEHYLSFVNGERSWGGVYINSDRAVTHEVYLVPQPDWGIARDWWLAGFDEFMGAVSRVATPPPRDIPAAGRTARRVVATNGATVIQPAEGLERVLFDPGQLEIELP